jgi:hypothetical protein
MSLRFGAVALFASLATAAAGCGGGTKACNPGTVFVTVNFDAQTKAADTVEIDVTVEGAQPQTTKLDHKAGDASGSIEVFFEHGYPMGKRVDVTVIALKSQEPMATGSAMIAMLPAGCASAVVNLTGSGGGDGAAGTSGAGGTTGAAGTDGGAGTTGAAGDDGGAAGTTGAAGADGGAGTTGAAGTDGGAGTTGAAGAPGCTEAATRPCSASGLLGKCATGTETCSGGKWGECSIKPATADLCDTKGDDSNCNGTANEGCPCLSGDSRACSDAGAMGNCAKGTQSCTNGKWGACSIVPTTVDSCATKGDDANCNGVPNEGCACLVGDAARSCSAAGAKGNCAAGTQACVDGQWGACSVKPAASDSCAVKGDDANCNGTPNDSCACLTTDAPRLCSVSGAKGNCAKGTQSCAAGVWGACSVQPAANDSCTVKGDDANCNGTPNDGCPCVSGDTQPCGPAAVGICKPGTQTCANGVWGACMGAVNKAARDCTSANDNDCDGKPDNTIDLVCTCASGASQACGAHPGADGKGPCKAGTQACVISGDKTTSAWGACTGSVGPAGADTCVSGNDDNCNGTPNESCACINNVSTRSCGYCNDGKQTCTDGKTNTYNACTGATGQDFTALPLTGTWTNSPYSTPPPAAALNCDGIVQLRGAASASGTDVTILTLPANLRPATMVYVPVDLCGATKGRLNIFPSGVVNVQAEADATKASCFTSMEGASFALSTTGFTAMTLLNGWTNAPYSTRNAAAKVANGIVRLEGAVANGTTSGLFTLPVGMRPPATVYINADLIGSKKGRIIIDAAGNVSVEAFGAFSDAQGFTSLEGVWFAVSTSGYSALSLQNGWTNYGTRNAMITTGNGIVRFQGSISTGGTNLSPFVLPVGFRPANSVYVPVDLCDAAGGRLNITPAGAVTIQVEGVTADATCFTSLEGVSFGL